MVKIDWEKIPKKFHRLSESTPVKRNDAKIEVKEVLNRGKTRTNLINADVYYVPVVNGKEYSYIAETEDVAMLIALQIKYDGLNSQFAKNTCRMLGIDSVWAK